MVDGDGYTILMHLSSYNTEYLDYNHWFIDDLLQ